MVLLLGAGSYIGQAFAKALRRRKDAFIPLSRNAFDYVRFEFLFDYVRKTRPDFLVNASGTPDNPALDMPEAQRMEMLEINALLPQTIARVCEVTNTPWGHVSSGSIYSGAKISDRDTVHIEEDLGRASTHALFAAHPESFGGFTETDEPNFSFKSAPCTFYSGTMALAEEALSSTQNYRWRLRLPFNEQDDPANFLSQLQNGATVPDGINSLSHLDDCVSACLELWDTRAPFGIYNVVNPGAVRTHDVVQKVHRVLKSGRPFQLLVYDHQVNRNGEKPPRSDCILDTSKLLKAGVKLRPAMEAIEKSLHKWERNASPMLKTLPYEYRQQNRT
jgi:UDP-glucose 4,6-dehydratase